MEKLNLEILATKFPHNFNRKCPAILLNQKMKSSELRNFLFYLAIPLLYNKIDKNHWYLLCLYVFAIRILYGPVNNKSKVVEAGLMLELYHDSLEDYYGKFAYTYTIHAHLHLSNQVLEHGPLHGHSQFFFEVHFYSIIINK